MMETSQDRVILVNKPLEWTSFDVVRKVRYLLKIKKVGHAGTLDPLATGLLILCTGKKTKEIEQYQAAEKEYTGRFRLGESTPSFDLETEVTERHSVDHLLPEDIYQTALAFTGDIMQTPPAHSAILIGGRRAYELARKGIEPEMKSRPVSIYQFEITSIQLPDVFFRVVCSKGTYIRSLARDFGMKLGVGAYLTDLCRTRIGDFRLEDAVEIDEIAPA